MWAVLEVGQIEARSAMLSWSPASDDVEVVGYRIEMNDLELQTTSGEALTLELTDLMPVTEYTITVSAEDGAGQRSEKLSVTFSTLDVDAPTWDEDDRVSVSELGPDRASVSWDIPVGEVARYRVFVEPDPYGIPLEVGDAFISLADLTPETEYRVEVLAIGPTSRMSDPTIEMGFMTPADVPPEWPMARR